jgi:hypothetical protein
MDCDAPTHDTGLSCLPILTNYERVSYDTAACPSPETVNAMSPMEIAQLRDLEEELLKPEVRRSADDVARLLADEFIEFGSSGRIFNKSQVIRSLQQEVPEAAVQITIVDFVTRRLAPGVVLVTYRTVRPDTAVQRLRSSIWKFEGGRWQMLFHQGTPSSPEKG